jgi:uncharacterized repeat protein (TIGR03803 family)
MFPPRLAFVALLVLCTAPVFGGNLTILHNFNPYPVGYSPSGTLVSDAAGNFYGVATQGGPYGAGEVFEVSPNPKGTYTLKLVYGFRNGNTPDQNGLAIDAAGNLYGTGSSQTGPGMVFALQPSPGGNWNFSILYQFTTIGGFAGPLAVDSSGSLFAETGPVADGSVIELTRSGGVWTESTVYQFSGGSDGSTPWSGLILDAKHNLYGVCQYGGAADNGVVFELTRSSGGSWTETVLHSFTAAIDGSYPNTRLVFDPSGNLYGAALDSPSPCASTLACGVVFELKPGSNGQWTESLVYDFGNPEGVGDVLSTLAFDAAGNLYGAAEYGGDQQACNIGLLFGCGVVFELSPGSSQWTESVLHTFTAGTDGYYPTSGITLNSAGQLFGVTPGGGGTKDLGTVYQVALVGGKWQERVLTNFNASNDGQGPDTGLVSDVSGNLYGTTPGGGAYGKSGGYGGTAFQLTPSAGGGWTTSIIYSFPSTNLSCCPASLTFDSAGNLYGTVQGSDTAFELSPASGGGWTEKDIFNFGKAGKFPSTDSFAMDSAGNLYGTLGVGGSGNGMVYELSRNAHGGWSLTSLHNFAGPPTDGAGPVGGVIFDAAGNLYGTTQQGGTGGALGPGTVYELSPAAGGGWSEKVLYSFKNSGGDGAMPDHALIFDTAGNLYGTTPWGGNDGEGTVFMLSPAAGGVWTETILHSFGATASDGERPEGPLTFDQAGNLYGATVDGGDTCNGGFFSTCGTVFKLSPTSGGGWNETIVHAFTGKSGHDGANPFAGVIIGPDGLLYGTTSFGGKTNQGTVFSIQP